MSHIVSDRVLPLDARAHRRAARETEEGWDPEEMRRYQESWCSAFRTPFTADWTTAWRERGKMLFSREDF